MKNYTRLAEVQADLQSKSINCNELVQSYLNRIEDQKHLNAFIETFDESALDQARKIDEKISGGEKLGELFGLVIAIKDNICFKGHKIQASSQILNSFESIYSSTVVDRLVAADAIIIGRTNCDEFAMGSSNENSSLGTVLNPIDESRVPGGSSGGSSAAVKADLCMASLGSDTGGSIRQPASFCDVVGFKPSYGRVSRYGLIAYASSFDQIGPFTKSVEDSARILKVIAGHDQMDPTSSLVETENYSEITALDKPSKFALIREIYEHEGLDPEIKKYTDDWVAKLREKGHTIALIDFPYLDYLIPTYYVLTTAEASSNLSRYDGVRYGYRSSDANDMEEVYTQSRSEGFGKEVKNRIMLGTFVLSSGYYDAYYTKGQKVRRLVSDAVAEIFKSYDFIINPTTPEFPFKFGEKSSDPVRMYLSDIYTVLANLNGSPAISLPLYRNEEGLPAGMQIMANRFEEKKLLDCAASMMS